MTTPIYVHTIGNSIIDNLPFLLNKGSPLEDAKNNSVEGQLQTQLDALEPSNEKKYEVVSHAYASFTPASVLDGDTIGKQLRLVPDLDSQAYNIYIQVKAKDNIDFVKPLEILEAKISENPKARHFVIIGFSLPTENHLEIVDRVQKMGGKPILIIPNLPQATDPIFKRGGNFFRLITLISAVCLAYLARFGMHVVQHKVNLYSLSTIFAINALLFLTLFSPLTYRVAKGQPPGMVVAKMANIGLSLPLLTYAKKEKLPIIDLFNTFDPHQTELYSSSHESSKEGGALIAKALCLAITQEHTNDSYIYTDKEACINNPNEWRVKV